LNGITSDIKLSQGCVEEDIELLNSSKSLITLHDQFLEQRQFNSLDGVRCFCILAVLWHHANPPNLLPILTRGFLGVDMFFVLSGFLIVTLLLREQSTVGKISLRKFYARRAVRIFPIYYGMLLFLTLFYGVFKSQDSSAAGFFSMLPFYATYTSNWSVVQAAGLGITWSLATEEQFYLFWPAIEKIYRKRVVYVVLGLILMINQLINFGYLNWLFNTLYGIPTIELEILDTTFTPICLGIGLAHLLHRSRSFNLVSPSLGHRHSPVVLLLVLLVVINFSPIDISGFPRLLIQLLMTLWLASLVVRENHSLQALMTAYPIVRIGKISYGMYMYHLWAFLIVAGTTRILTERWGITLPFPLFMTGTLATFLISEISYRFYETPFLRLKTYLSWQPKH
jgi:peptidoglycan/LPS O-acetylase OafA/YrhL